MTPESAAISSVQPDVEPHATYIYCVVKASRAPSAGRVPSGVPGAGRPRVAETGGDLWMVVSDVPLATYGPEPLEARLRDVAWLSEVAVAHEAVVAHFARLRNATAIPMKLFTMFSTRDRAAADVRARRREIDAVVKRIEGCEEWAIRVTRRDGPAAPARSAPARASSGTAFLAARKKLRDDAREASVRAAQVSDAAFEQLAAAARAWSRRDDVPEGATSPPLLDAAFLVPRDGRAKFKAAARRAAEACARAGGAMTLTGPWPAYNFVRPPRSRP